MHYLSFKKWDRFQHYKKRNPVWIKLYLDILDKPEFVRLDTYHKCALFTLLVLAGRTGNRIPLDIRFLHVYFPGVDRVQAGSSLCGPIQNTGWTQVSNDADPETFVEPVDFAAIFASSLLESCYKNASIETETEYIKRENPPIPPLKSANKSNGTFELFWASYPRKVGKGAAEKSWLRIHPTQELIQAIILAIETQQQSEQWTKNNGEFIPHPATWLNQRRWEDEIRTEVSLHDQLFGKR